MKKLSSKKENEEVQHVVHKPKVVPRTSSQQGFIKRIDSEREIRLDQKVLEYASNPVSSINESHGHEGSNEVELQIKNLANMENQQDVQKTFFKTPFLR